MRTASALIALALLLAIAPATIAQEKPAPATDSKVLAERSYFAYFNGSRIGWQKQTRSQFVKDGKTLIREADTMYLKISRDFDGLVIEIRSESENIETLEGLPVSKQDVSVNGAQTTTRTATFNEDNVVVTEVINDAKPVVYNVDAKGRKVATGNWAWQQLKSADRVKKGETIEFEKLDMEKHVIEKESWTVSGSVTRKLTAGTTVTGTEVISVSGGNVSKIVVDNDGMALLATLQGGFTIEVTKSIPKDFTAEPVSIQSAMDAKPAIKDQFKLKTMDVVIPFEHDDTDGVEPLLDTNGYHDVMKYKDDKGSGYGLRLKDQKLPADFKAPALPLADLPEDVKRYTKPTTICQSDDTDLMKEAKRLTGGVTDSRKAAEAICNWVYKYLTKASGDTGSASAKQAYEEKQGDCTEHSVLFVAVARAAGLPARNIGGIVYLASGDNAFFGYHAWSEVWLGQWVPVDATVNEVGTSARYMMFHIDEPGDTHGSGRISRCIGQKIKPQIDAYAMANGAGWKRKGARELKFTKD